MRYTIFLFLLISVYNYSSILEVPSQYTTIQTAVNASSDGDTIVVSPGIYYENINFLGKNIVVTSLFYIDKNTEYIGTTVIDGSTPLNQDTASVVLFINNENEGAVLQGFTIQNGRGTKWTDEHGGGIYTEGGGILIGDAAPVIQFNKIINNRATDTRNANGAGGGGIRAGDSSPVIRNNVFFNNSGLYGGGLVLNFSAGIVENNIFYANLETTGGKESYGGAGIAVFNKGNGAIFINNNTFVGNKADGAGSTLAGRGGAVLIWNGNVNFNNNIVWDNEQKYGKAVYLNGTNTLSYNDLQDDMTGTGNINTVPEFVEDSFKLADGSPCIDAGNPESQFDDVNNGVMATPPAKGTKINDMGAYGGPRAAELADFDIVTSVENEKKSLIETGFRIIGNYPNPFNPTTVIRYYLPESGNVTLKVMDALGKEIANEVIDAKSGENGYKFDATGLASGVYFYRVEYQGNMAQTQYLTGKMLYLK